MAKEEAELKTQAPLTTDNDTIILDENSGISKEDQQEIITEIEKIASESRIQVTPEVFNVQALKNGVIFPMIVNLAAVILLVAGIITLYSLFQYNETQLVAEEKINSIAESQLIKEVKKQSEEELNAKNQQINDIQSKLANINKERDDLLATMDSKVKEKESAMRKALESELDSERERLRQSGISEQEIRQKIAALESQKEATYQQQLVSMRKDAEQERKKLEDNYTTLRSELTNNLTKINEEKRLIAEEAQKRENALRLQLEEKTKALESAQKAKSQQLSATETELSVATNSLKQLSEQKEKEELVQNQILGFYNSVKQNIINKDFARAISNLDTIRNYLNNESVIVLPSVLKRREVEFFVVDSLKSMVESEMNKDEVDTASLIASANLVTDIKAKIVTADQLYAMGNIERAEKLYKEALELLPEVSRSHNYFIKKREIADQEKQRILNDFLTRANTAFEARDYSSALNYYSRALAVLPTTDLAVSTMVANIQAVGYRLGLKALVEKDEEIAQNIQQKAQTFFQAQQYSEAIITYIDLVMRYPYSSRVDTALSGIRQAVEAKNRQAQEQYANLQASINGRISNMNETLQAKISEINTLQQEKNTLLTENQTLKTRLAELEKRGTRTGKNESSESKIRVDEKELQKLKESEALANNYILLKNKYADYAVREDDVLKKQGSDGLLESKVYLDRFLSSQEVEQLFPGLWERIKHYDEAFEKVGRDFTLQEVSDVVYDLASLNSKTERLAYLDEEIKKNKQEPLLVNFFSELKGLMK